MNNNTYKQIEPHTSEPDPDEIQAKRIADRARIEREMQELWESEHTSFHFEKPIQS